MNINVKCPLCQLEKPTTDFYKSTRRKSGLYGYCKHCFNKYNDNRRLQLKQKAVIYKGSKCNRCGISYPLEPAYIFDFHHIDPKTKGDWDSIRKMSWNKIQKELDKCVLLCSNCHRKVEFEKN